MTEPGVRLIDVDGVPNFRDLGGRIGLGGRRVRERLVYRSSGANRNATTNDFPGADRITDAGRRAMLKFFDGFPGPTLREKVEAYLKTCGITPAGIESFRKLMLED